MLYQECPECGGRGTDGDVGECPVCDRNKFLGLVPAELPAEPDYEVVARLVYMASSGGKPWESLTDQQQDALISVTRTYVDSFVDAAYQPKGDS